MEMKGNENGRSFRTKVMASVVAAVAELRYWSVFSTRRDYAALCERLFEGKRTKALGCVYV